MPRYIDAEKLKQDIIANSPFEYGQSVDVGVDEILELIDEQPTADVEEVKHGEWEVLWKEKKPYILQCSECGVISDKLSHFCSYCGAKMDGRKGE